jgi:hypothetical protein
MKEQPFPNTPSLVFVRDGLTRAEAFLFVTALMLLAKPKPVSTSKEA